MFKPIDCLNVIALVVALQITGSAADDAEWDRTVLPRPPQPFQGVTKRSLEGSIEGAVNMLTTDNVRKALRAVKDPELGLNIIDLGLVYDVEVSEPGDVHVKMTLTSPGCPAGPEILQDAKLVLEQLEGVTSADVELVWEPYWTPDRMDPRVRAFLF